jgi:hypothetical protein
VVAGVEAGQALLADGARSLTLRILLALVSMVQTKRVFFIAELGK